MTQLSIRRFIAGLLFPVLLSQLSIHAVEASSAMWSAAPGSGDWNTASNWIPVTIPNGPLDSATFATSSMTDVSISADTEVSGIVFPAGSAAYTVATSENFALTLSGTGLTNNSGVTQTFVVGRDVAFNPAMLIFLNQATAGEASQIVNDGGFTEFLDMTSAEQAVIQNDVGLVMFRGTASAAESMITNAIGGPNSGAAGTDFQGSATAGHAHIVNNDGPAPTGHGGTSFNESASASEATFVNQGGTTPSSQGGYTAFYGDSTAVNSTITNTGAMAESSSGGDLQFVHDSTAANATITNGGGVGAGNNGGLTQFFASATAGEATLIANGGVDGGKGGQILFWHSTSGGSARVELFENGNLDISVHDAPGLTIGSIEGTGNIFLGANNLTVGSNGLSVAFAGIIQDGGVFHNENGSLTKTGPATWTLSGANTFTGGTTVEGGELVLDGSLASGVSLIDGGALSGSGTVNADLDNTSGSVILHRSNGDLTVAGDFTQESSGSCRVELAGPTLRTDYTQLIVNGTANLDGTLEVVLLDGFRPAVGDTFQIVVAGGVSGSFSAVQTHGFSAAVDYATGGVTLRVTSVAGIPLNISTRLRVGIDDNVLIGGFILTGTESKTVIVRGIGPSLEAFGVPDVLPDPILELHDASGATIASNNDWKETQQSEIEQTGLEPANELEAAIVRQLDPGAYTVVMRGNNAGTGVGLVEAYDLEADTRSQLGNLSTRGLVGAESNVMIGGFIVQDGADVARILVRAIGPSLAMNGIAGALQDPAIDLYNGDGAVVAQNNDWKETQQAEIDATGLSPADDKESAILALLPNGNYTAIVHGVNETTGVALVEIYSVP